MLKFLPKLNSIPTQLKCIQQRRQGFVTSLVTAVQVPTPANSLNSSNDIEVTV